MPIVEIDGIGRVELGNEFTTLSPEQQDATIQEIAATARKGNVTVKSNTQQAAPSVAEDVAKSLPSGFAKGVAGIAGLPELGQRCMDFIAKQTVGRGINAYKTGGRDWSPAPSERASTTADMIAPPSADAVTRRIESVTGPLHQPQTRAGKFAASVGEFLPGAVAGPGGVAGNMIKFGAVPGVVSEAAGQVTEGSPYEPVARVAGALTGAGAAALVSRPSRTSQIIREQMPEGVTPQMVDDAEALIIDAAQQGIALTWPEALSQTAGRPILTNTMRHLEASPQSEARMAEFFGQRPAQVDAAAGQAFDSVTPAAPNPSMIGPAVGAAAEDTVNSVRGAINRASEPYYNAASTQRIPGAEMARIRAVPGWKEARDAVRGDPQLNRYVAHLPDNSVGFVDAVKKHLDQAAENAAAPVNQQRSMRRSAGYSSDAALVRNIAEAASPDYAAALQIQRQLREQHLEPLLKGPLGDLAKKDITTRNAIDALFPHNPIPNSADEIATAVSALAKRNPYAARSLVRAHVESVFNQASKDLIAGANPAGGAKFRAALVGNPQSAANLEAAIRALPNGDQIWPGINRFLDVLQATGTRQNVGSRTAYNLEFDKSLAASNLVGETSKAVANPLRGAQFLADKYERYRLGNNLNELATIFTDPKAANLFRAIAKMPAGSKAAQSVAVRIALLTNAAAGAPR